MADKYLNIPVPTPTQKPVPSPDIRDHVFGGSKVDEFVTSLQREYEDRFGKRHYTIEGLRWIAQQAIANFGYITLKSFQAGAPLPNNELTLPNQVLQDETDGEYYRWDGTFPKTVPSGSTPATAGGVGLGKWVSVGDASLRANLASPSGGSLVKLANGKTVQQDSEQSGLARGNDGTKYALSGAAFRRYAPDSPDWTIVQDPTHIPVNTFSIENGVDVTIHYKGSKIGSLVCGPDESLAKDGVLVGGSVGPDRAIISLGAPCSFIVDLDDPSAPIVYDSKFFDAVRFGITISSGGQVTVAHPQRRLMQYPIVQHFSDNSSFEPLTVHYVSSPSPGGFTCFLVGEAEGLISYSGTEWTIGSSSWSTSELTFSWEASTGVLTVTHPQLLGSPGINITALDNGSTVFTSLSSVSGTGFKVKFRRQDNTIPILSNALGFYFSRGMSAIRKAPTGKLHIYLGHVQVNCNHVSYEFGNFWTLGLMGDES